MTAEFPLHLIPLLPFIGAAIALVIGRRLGNNIITLLCCGSVASSERRPSSPMPVPVQTAAVSPQLRDE